MTKFKRIIWSDGITVNGTKCRLKRIYVYGTAWSRGYYRHVILTDELTAKDMDLYKSLNLPNWHLDYTGKALVVELGYQDYGATDKIVNALQLRNIQWSDTSYEY
jgi:hypothetical protein